MPIPPRVLFVDHAASLSGAELYLLDLAVHYRRSARVVLFEEGPFRTRLVEAGVDARVLPAPDALLGVAREGGLRAGLAAVPALLRLAGRLARMARGYDLLYANSQKALVVSALASLLARRPLIWNLHDILTADHFSAVNRRVAVALANACAARVVVNSEATRLAFVQSGGRGAKTALVFNGIRADAFQPRTAAERQALRQRLGVDDASVVGVFSRLAAWKGQDVLLRALPELPGVHALLVGKAMFQEDRQYERELHRLTEALGLQDRVHFLGFRRDVPALMQAVDVVAHTSTAPEPFGRVIVEGLMAGTPVVAARAGGALEIIDDGCTGRLVTPGDPEALARTLADVLVHPEEASRLAARGRRAAEDRFSIEAMLHQAEAVIGEVATPR